MQSEHRKRAVLVVRLLRSAILRPKCAKFGSLALAEFDLADLGGLPLRADNSLQPALPLADRLFEVLATLYGSDDARLLERASFVYDALYAWCQREVGRATA